LLDRVALSSCRGYDTTIAPEAQPPVQDYDPFTTSPPAPPTGPHLVDGSDALPERIGRYRVEKVLGEGGFGLVYLAHDEQLQRLVAVKVPHARLVGDAEAYLTEARTVANLDHPNIVPVFDIGSTEEFPCFVVSKYIDGTDLASRLKHSKLSLDESVELVATVAEALHHAHKQGLVHRDVKPGNLLLDRSGKPFVADFGLALREQEVGKGPRFAGTPTYMSPEQARSEGHRVDGRSDIFSLGVVFYELLVGRRPFHGETRDDLLEQIISIEARPPRMIDDRIPKELERICLKALAKRASERYTTAKDMADDLRHFLAGASAEERSTITGRQRQEVDGVSATPTPTDQQAVKIVPKGLRSFDACDADFFLELLPGPRDRDGLPDSLRFWKTRIEEADADQTFAVGLIYGPSGCGKSSLVKAGLLPRLAKQVAAVYVEATAEETESRLSKSLRRQVPDLPGDLGLVEALAVLRQGRFLASGQKVLLVLDQFEQWLHTKRKEENTELVQALRQCDGGRVQCIVMVRDDFWLAVSRFMKALEVEILEGRNSALVDLFDLLHGRKVLAAFGRAYGRLPDNLGQCSKEQDAFLDQAVAGLAQDGKVVSVRLALFAEMVKGKLWTPTTLKEVGGAEGIGVTFLEETFTASTAPPQHRLHQKAAQAVLKALLPDAGTDIKGHMRSQQELLEASGYSGRPKDFDALLRILDGELRLITPTDPEGQEGVDESTFQVRPGQRFFQLTHDYLVPALRAWLTRKQKETRRGRAEFLLADRAAVWNARPEKRQLPSLLQWLQIKWLTAKKNWTPPQKKMMRKATRHHVGRGLVAAAFLVLVCLGGWEGYGRLEGRQLRDRVLDAKTADVPGIVKEMASYRRWVNPLLQEAYAQAERDNDRAKQLHASLALLPADSGQVEYLYERLLKGDPQEVVVIREALFDHRAELTEHLWALLENRKKDQGRRFRAGCALAAFSPDDARWEKVGGDVAATLVIQKPFVIAQWTNALKDVGRWLLPSLAGFLVDEKRSVSERGLIATLYGTYAADVPDAYARLEKQLDETSKPDATAEAKEGFARRQASVGVALLVMGRGERVWPLLKHSPDPTLRSFLIERFGPGGVDAGVLTARLEEEKEVSVKRAIQLSLGEYGLDRLPPTERRNLLPRLLELYQDNPDPGVHGAAEWLLRQWGASDELEKRDKELTTGKVEGKRQWYVNRQGQTMVVVPKPGEFWMGEGGLRHRRRIARSFAIASREVTVEQFLRFRMDDNSNKLYAPTGNCPVNSVSWCDAAAYCNWLSEKEGIAKEQWCYEPNKEGKYAEGMKMAPDYLKRTGYRLPTEAEWEFACRAGADTGYSFAESADLLGKYAWFAGNSLSKSHPVGSLKPNDLGLFDMHGNVWEWCQDAYKSFAKGADDTYIEDKEDLQYDIRIEASRMLRGGSFNNLASYVRSAYRNYNGPAYRISYGGFRPARTFSP
jgi:serine/threonine protein kinase/formylglycine-generating enzyme required for sulfatase activity